MEENSIVNSAEENRTNFFRGEKGNFIQRQIESTIMRKELQKDPVGGRSSLSSPH
jgi:hypothetical protein